MPNENERMAVIKIVTRHEYPRLNPDVGELEDALTQEVEALMSLIASARADERAKLVAKIFNTDNIVPGDGAKTYEKMHDAILSSPEGGVGKVECEERCKQFDEWGKCAHCKKYPKDPEHDGICRCPENCDTCSDKCGTRESDCQPAPKEDGCGAG